ncbi:hypothetical protein GCM10027190_35730 [Spirosoma areae]
MLSHGLQKAFGWFGGYGFTGTIQFFTQTIGLPWLLGFLVIVFETVGALALILGVLTRVNALATFFIILGAVLTVHLPVGYWMNWTGKQAGEGYEMHLLLLSMSLVLLLVGGGRYSIDQFLSRQSANQVRQTALSISTVLISIV